MKTFAALALLMTAGAVVGQQPDAEEAVKQVRKHVEALPNGGADGTYQAQTDAALKNAFPDYRFVIVRFRVFPIARVMPDGMHPSNVFVVGKGDKFEQLKDAKSLETFFRGQLAPVKTADEATSALAAWLALSPEYHQDGMFKFETLVKEFAGDASKVTGRAIVSQGGNGELRAELTFDREGKLAKVEEKAALRRGPRPICQATKLLDADPIVRRMAEEDLLIMGRSAREYLEDQRQRAAPQLREAIERVWRQIEKNGW